MRVPGAQGSKGVTGPRGVQGAPGAPGTTRAYAIVAADGTVNPALSKNIAVNKNGAGTYCVTLGGGINPATRTLSASVIFTLNGAANTDIQVANPAIADSGNCGAGQFEVITRPLLSTAVGDPVATNRTDEAFSIVVA